MIQLDHPYTPRPVRFLELWEWQGWRMKIYGIAAQAQYPSEELVQAAKKIAKRRLPQPALSDRHYGVGFMIIHDGANGDYVFVDCGLIKTSSSITPMVH